ncbi:MAG: SufE family protein [Bosea sp. (in: a-proteobacteria)]
MSTPPPHSAASSAAAPALAGPLLELVENFEMIEDWEERYRYLIEIGRDLPPMADADKSEENRVKGCASQVWLVAQPQNAVGTLILTYRGDSDAHIVRGLVAITLLAFSGKTPEAILATDLTAIFDRIGLSQHLTPQRSNGVRAMVERIRADARRLQLSPSPSAAG